MTRAARLLEELHESVLIGDGAIGTELFRRGAMPDRGVERTNLLAPGLVLQLHREYAAAGSRVLETNTFGANLPNLSRYGVESEQEVREIILAGVRLAREAAVDGVYVAGSIGPHPVTDTESVSEHEQTALMAAQVSALLEGGVDALIFESFTSLDDLVQALRIARPMTDIPIIAQAAFGPDERTADGGAAEEVAQRCTGSGADVVGANCGYGVSSVLKAVKRIASISPISSAYMNAGFPERVEERLLYHASPDYLVRAAVELVESGASLVGGCCGTDPALIKLMSRALREHVPSHFAAPHIAATPPACVAAEHAPPTAPGFRVLVELDPPAGLDMDPLTQAARDIRDAGASAFTVADNPLASARVDSVAVADMLQRECDLPAIPHLTCRDRNRIAIQSTLMAAHVRGIRSILCVTGDPVRMCQEPNTSGVFDTTSVGLVKMVDSFNSGHPMKGECATSFAIGVALNPNVRSLSGQVDKLARKVEAGAHFALTQPVFDRARVEAMLEALAKAGIDIPIYVGVMPLVSSRNAEFLHNEVPGIVIPDAIRARMATRDTLADQRADGQQIALELIDQFADLVSRFYFICPRNRAEWVVTLVRRARALAGADVPARS